MQILEFIPTERLAMHPFAIYTISLGACAGPISVVDTPALSFGRPPMSPMGICAPCGYKFRD
jgi:hypothetical protein